jgi:hypothetical protein
LLDNTSGFEAHARVGNGCHGRRVADGSSSGLWEGARGRHHQERHAYQNASQTAVEVPQENFLSKTGKPEFPLEALSILSMNMVMSPRLCGHETLRFLEVTQLEQAT